MNREEYHHSTEKDQEYFPYSEEIYGSETERDTEFYRAGEYESESVPQKNKEEEGQERARKRRRKMIPYFMTAAACAAAIAVSTPVSIPLSDVEKAYVEELQTAFDQQDYDEVLKLTIGGEKVEALAIRREKLRQTETYVSLLEKGTWSEEHPVVVLLGDQIQMQEKGTGLGLAFQEKKLYYGMLKDGFPEGEGICYRFSSGYYSYTRGRWKGGLVNGYAENSFWGYTRDPVEILREWCSGYYVNDLANGEMTATRETIYPGEVWQIIYEADHGHLVLDDRWEWYWNPESAGGEDIFRHQEGKRIKDGKEISDVKMEFDIRLVMKHLSKAEEYWIKTEKNQADLRPVFEDGTELTEEMVKEKQE